MSKKGALELFERAQQMNGEKERQENTCCESGNGNMVN